MYASSSSHESFQYQCSFSCLVYLYSFLRKTFNYNDWTGFNLIEIKKETTIKL
ncbi:hypothetical protein B4133_1348 [Bacillus altitudinis]|nr:hypothetical protein B4133_1348 [Bacillus altitudinis]